MTYTLINIMNSPPHPTHTYHWYARTPVDKAKILEIVILIENRMCMIGYKSVSLIFDELPSIIKLNVRQGSSHNIDTIDTINTIDEYDDDEILSVVTDGNIASKTVLNHTYSKYSKEAMTDKRTVQRTDMSDLNWKDFCYIPLGMRYGAFNLSRDNTLEYKKDFWNHEVTWDQNRHRKPQMMEITRKTRRMPKEYEIIL